MTIEADYILDGSGIQVRKIQGRIALVTGVASQAMPAAFANVPTDWPVLVTRNNAGTSEGWLSAAFDNAGPEINITSSDVTDDAVIAFVIEVPASLFG